MNLAKCTLKKISYKFENQWICMENQLSGFYFKITLNGNELSITNNEVNWFSNSFQITKNLKYLENWLTKYIFAYNLKTRFCRHKALGRITKATMTHHLTPKKVRIDGPIFFQNPYCWFISEHYLATLTKPNNHVQRYWQFVISEHHWQFVISEHYGRAGPYPRKTSWSKCRFQWISYYLQKANFLPQIVFEISKFKKSCNLTGREHFQLQAKN